MSRIFMQISSARSSLDFVIQRIPVIPLPIVLITHHRLKVHLLLHQSFRDLCCLLEMNIVWKNTTTFK